jgi:hypothetical protein
MQGVHRKSKSEPDKAQEEQHFGKGYRDPRTHSLEEAKTESSKSEASKSSGGRTSSSVGSQWRIPRIVRFEVGVQALTLRRSRRGDREDLNGPLRRNAETPQFIG